MLQMIDSCCFYHSGLEEFVAPPRLKRIRGGAFLFCENLKQVTLNEGLEALKGYSDDGVF